MTRVTPLDLAVEEARAALKAIPLWGEGLPRNAPAWAGPNAQSEMYRHEQGRHLAALEAAITARAVALLVKLVEEAFKEGYNEGLGDGHPLSSGADSDRAWKRSMAVDALARHQEGT